MPTIVYKSKVWIWSAVLSRLSLFGEISITNAGSVACIKSRLRTCVYEVPKVSLICQTKPKPTFASRARKQCVQWPAGDHSGVHAINAISTSNMTTWAGGVYGTWGARTPRFFEDRQNIDFPPPICSWLLNWLLSVTVVAALRIINTVQWTVCTCILYQYTRHCCIRTSCTCTSIWILVYLYR